MMFKAVYLALLFAVSVKSSRAFLYPLHASCELVWNWPADNCSKVETKIIDQIKAWSNSDCGSGEKCGYALKTASDTELTATHTTPVSHYVDDLTMKFSSSGSGGCSVQGHSTSETWYAVLDYGTNYCNLHNLIEGAKMDTWSGYTEKVEDSTCTQYSKADCQKY